MWRGVGRITVGTGEAAQLHRWTKREGVRFLREEEGVAGGQSLLNFSGGVYWAQFVYLKNCHMMWVSVFLCRTPEGSPGATE